MPYVVIDHILYEQSRKENTYYRIYEEKPVRPGGVKAGREQGCYPRYKLLEQVSQNGSENPDKETEPVFVITSAKKRAGIDQLEDTLVKVINSSKTNSSDSIVINERHYQALSKASKNMDDVISGLKNLMPADLVSQDLREMLLNLSTISGEITSQEILNNIFSHFCIGK